MITVRVKCVRKSASLDANGAVVTELGFQQNVESGTQFATGAVIGTPNAPTPSDPALTREVDPQYNLSTAITLVVTDSDEVNEYAIGEYYLMALNADDKSNLPVSDKKVSK